MYVGNHNSVQIEFKFLSTTHGRAAESALLDSGATDNFVDHHTASRLQIHPKELPRPRLLHNVDGTENRTGKITQYCDLLVRCGEQETVQRFYLASLGKDRFILGFPWLSFFNPDINWRAKKILGPPLHIEETMRTAEHEPHILRHAQIVA